MTLEVQHSLVPMEALPVDDLPSGADWLFEPKYDGFRCLLFRDGDTIDLQSRRQRPLGRYFPEIIEAARELPLKQFVFDGELIVPDQPFDALQLRLHPAASRVQKLSREHPAQVVVFDLLANGQGQPLLNRPFRERRAALEDAFKRIGKASSFVLSKATTSSDTARKWLERLGHGLDGIVAKRLELPVPARRARDAEVQTLENGRLRCGWHLLQAQHDVGRISANGLVRRCRAPELYRPVRRWRQRPRNR